MKHRYSLISIHLFWGSELVGQVYNHVKLFSNQRGIMMGYITHESFQITIGLWKDSHSNLMHY